MRGIGTIVNIATVLMGTAIGVVAGQRLPERLRTTVLSGIGLMTIVIGVQSASDSHNLVFPLVALIAGGAIGELIGVEERLEGLGDRLRRRFERKSGDDQDQPSTFTEGFVAASLLFCTGPLTILGSIQDGLGGPDHAQLLFVKSALDGLVAVIFASTLGWGVGFSVLTIAVIQGALTLGAGAADRVLTERMIAEMTATGGVMILGIGVRLLDVKKVRVGSFLPALVLAPILVALFAR